MSWIEKFYMWSLDRKHVKENTKFLKHARLSREAEIRQVQTWNRIQAIQNITKKEDEEVSV